MTASKEHRSSVAELVNQGSDDGAYGLIMWMDYQAIPRCVTQESAVWTANLGCSSANASRRRRKRLHRKAGAPISFAYDKCQVNDVLTAGASSISKEDCETLMCQLEADIDSQLLALSSLRGQIWAFAQDEHGCRVIQMLLGKQRNIAESVAVELYGHVRQALSSPHANFVIQRLVEVMPTAQSAFVVEELNGVAANVARHCYGCRVLIRIIEHSANEVRTLAIMEEVLSEVAELVLDRFGHYVIQAILEHGTANHRHRIASALVSPPDGQAALLYYACHRNSSRVIESAITHCALEDRSSLCNSFLNHADVVLHMAQDAFGCYVLMSAIRNRGECTQTEHAKYLIQSISSILAASKHGKKVLDLVNGNTDDH